MTYRTVQKKKKTQSNQRSQKLVKTIVMFVYLIDTNNKMTSFFRNKDMIIIKQEEGNGASIMHKPKHIG